MPKSAKNFEGNGWEEARQNRICPQLDFPKSSEEQFPPPESFQIPSRIATQISFPNRDSTVARTLQLQHCAFALFLSDAKFLSPHEKTMRSSCSSWLLTHFSPTSWWEMHDLCLTLMRVCFSHCRESRSHQAALDLKAGRFCTVIVYFQDFLCCSLL